MGSDVEDRDFLIKREIAGINTGCKNIAQDGDLFLIQAKVE